MLQVSGYVIGFQGMLEGFTAFKNQRFLEKTGVCI